MQATGKNRKTSVAPTELPDNALAKKVLEEIQKIDADAKQKKLAQIESLVQAKDNILERMRQLQHQLAHIENAIATINGKPVHPRGEKKPRRDLEEVRIRVGRWMEGHKGQQFMAGDLTREFPELDGVAISLFIKPLVQAGTVKTDASEGNRRTKYFVAEG